MPTKLGGLGVKNFEWFNISLIGKWLWRFLVETDALWVKVVKGRHGGLVWDGEGFNIEGNRSRTAGWWKSMVGLSRGEAGKGIRENLRLHLGEGDKIQFWHHVWAGESSLKMVFPRLFRLSSNQGGTISNMGFWDQGEWKWNLGWTRDLLDREKEVVDRLLVTINSMSLRAGIVDAWRWYAEPNGEYTTKSAYNAFSSRHLQRIHNGNNKIFSSIWKAPVPFKASITAWRVLKGKIATCENLARRGVTIPRDDAKCVACKDVTESTNHLFFSCGRTYKIWASIIQWIRNTSVCQNSAMEHLDLFTNLGSKADTKFLTGVWIATVWCIWKWRNECKFNNANWDSGKVFGEIKSRLWSWKLAFDFPSQATDFRSWFAAAPMSNGV